MSGICIALAVLCVVLAASLGSTVSQIRKERKRFNSLNRQYHAFYQRFKNIIDVEEAHAHLSKLFNMERARAKSTMLDLKRKHDQMFKAHENNKKQLSEETERIVHTINSLQEELDQLTINVHLQELGFYKPRYIFDTSDGYKRKLDEIRNTQKALLSNQKAAIGYTETNFMGNSKEGKKITHDTLKLVLRAFNAECDAAVAQVNTQNIGVMEKRINKAFEAINMIARFRHVEVTHEYLRLKLNELYLTHEFHNKQEEEKEEQRKLKEKMNEEANTRRELERAAFNAEEEEERLTTLLAEAHKVAENATDDELALLLEEIERLEARLGQAQRSKKQATSQLQHFTAGHVYVLSNIGSFGENIFKIGMTRRLNPLAYIKQFSGDAVPFDFDVHALIYSEDATGLVAELQKELASKRVNLENNISEFYNVTLDEIERILQSYDTALEVKQDAAAEEYSQSPGMQDVESFPVRHPAAQLVESPDIMMALAEN